MFKRICFLYLVSLIGLFSGTINRCLATTYDTVTPAKQNVISLIGTGKYTEADAATNKLIADFVNSPGADEAVHQIALKHQEVKNYQKTIDLSRSVITNWPQSKHAGWAQMDIVMANLYLKNETSAKAEIGTLISRYKDDPNLPRMLYIINQEYKSADYAQILKQNFNSVSSAKIQLAILNADILAKIESGDRTAGRDIDQMMAEFSSDADFPEMLLTIAQAFSWKHQYEQAGNICQKIIQLYPTSQIAAKAQQCISKTGQINNIATTLINSGDYGKVGKAVEELIAKFGDEVDTPATVFDIANKLESAGKFALAKQVYEQIIWRYPKDKFADMSRIAVQRTKGLALDESGDETSAKSIFDSVFKDFQGHSYLPANVIWTAEGYYRRACKAQDRGDDVSAKRLFDKAINILDIVNTSFSSSEEVPNACFLAGDCYRRLGDYQKSIESYQKVVDRSPSYSRAGRALFMVGRNLEDMQTLGLASGPEVDEAITAAYKRLIKDYPNCDTVKLAENCLNQHNAK
jgi:TolA-binding protein